MKRLGLSSLLCRKARGEETGEMELLADVEVGQHETKCCTTAVRP